MIYMFSKRCPYCGHRYGLWSRILGECREHIRLCETKDKEMQEFLRDQAKRESASESFMRSLEPREHRTIDGHRDFGRPRKVGTRTKVPGIQPVPAAPSPSRRDPCSCGDDGFATGVILGAALASPDNYVEPEPKPSFGGGEFGGGGASGSWGDSGSSDSGSSYDSGSSDCGSSDSGCGGGSD